MDEALVEEKTPSPSQHTKVQPEESKLSNTKKAPRKLLYESGALRPQEDGRGKLIRFPGNAIRTCKYTILNFIPRTLFEQFIRPANFYFLIVMILQTYRPISTTQGFPSMIFPLAFVISVSALKGLYEDLKRREEDKKENMRMCSVLNKETCIYESQHSRDLRVGDFLKITDDQIFPADLLLLQSGLDDGAYCYVETANVDGETNLKIKVVPESFKNKFRTDQELGETSFEMSCDPPNGSLERWNAYLSAFNCEVRLNQDSLLLRGTKLRNAKYVLAMVVYTGEDSKIRMNSSERNPKGLQAFCNAKLKKSRTETLMEKLIIGMFLFQICLCIVCGILNGVWEQKHDKHFYLMLQKDHVASGAAKIGTWFLTFVNFVPISLLVTMEMVKFLQGRFFGWDVMMSAVVGEELHFARAQTSALNEELGQIQYVLSDKTGTLTCNSMDFRKAIIGSCQYGTGETDISRGAAQLQLEKGIAPTEAESKEAVFTMPHVNFNAKDAVSKVLFDKQHPDHSFARDYFLALALGNTVFPTVDAEDNPEFKASSPDEECLVHFSNAMGCTLSSRSPPLVTLALKNEQETFTQLACLDFTSKRKHMAVIIRHPDRSISMYAKGADAFIEPILEGYGDEEKFAAAQPNWKYTMSQLDRFADQGLRTLLVAAGNKPASWWDDPQTGWKVRYESRMRECAIEGPDEEGHIQGNCGKKCRRCALEFEIEKDCQLRLVGATAIEDKLQDFVPLTIKLMLDAGIKVWVLTGDKLETAINIAMACNLLEISMTKDNRLLMVDGEDAASLRTQLTAHDTTLTARLTASDEPFGFVFTTGAFFVIEESMRTAPDLVDLFVSVATRCKSAVGCRMQPNQKAKVVKLVKDTQKVTTLAIGDGANDEQMIREAHVGVGIRGVEGTTAVRAADYAISQFHFLRRVLFVWGRSSYRQIADMLFYIMYKQSMICFVVFWLGFLSGFSGTQLYLEWSFQLYSVGYTALMIISYAVFDRDIDNRTLISSPKIYQATHKGELFTIPIFLRWITTSFVQSAIIFWSVQFAYDSETDDFSGRALDHWNIGLVVYTCVVLVANFKVCMMITHWNWVNHLVLWPSLALFFVANLVFSTGPSFSVGGADYTYAMIHLLQTALYYLVVFGAVSSALLFDYAWTCVENMELLPCYKKKIFETGSMRSLAKAV